MAAPHETIETLRKSIQAIKAHQETDPRTTAEAESAYYGLKALLAVRPVELKGPLVDILQIMDLGDPDGPKTYFIHRVMTPGEGSVVSVFILPGIDIQWPQDSDVPPIDAGTEGMLIEFDSNTQPVRLAMLDAALSLQENALFYDEETEILVSDMKTVPQKAELFRKYHRLFENLIIAHQDYLRGEAGEDIELPNDQILTAPIFIMN